VNVNDVLRLIQQDGWILVATRGSHRQFKHPLKPGRVTIPGKPSDDLAPGTLNSILKQAPESVTSIAAGHPCMPMADRGQRIDG
jgi:predicted RNA binding protein YcfA (HicA-like mRNA interferase family)